ncbi:MAG: hypothetical protein LBJ31_00960 [Treponema sp.]|jgi:hypothetical protein|nr:hypothetical protein [Treponema sp.]
MTYKSMRVLLFAYDCLRLFFLLAILLPLSDFDPPRAGIPLLMYAAPNALFPLMSLFLLIRFEASKQYIPLYATGKLVVLACVVVWLFFDLHLAGMRRPLFWAFIGAADLGSLGVMALLKGEE